MKKNTVPTPSQPAVRGWWLIVSGVALIAALAAPLWIIPSLPDPVAAAGWVVVIGVIVNGVGMAIRAGVHGAPRGSFLAWMDGAGKVLSLIGWSSALLFVGFNALRNTSPASLDPAVTVIVSSAMVIGGGLFLWGGILLILSWTKPKRQPMPEDGSEGGGDVDAARPGR